MTIPSSAAYTAFLRFFSVISFLVNQNSDYHIFCFLYCTPFPIEHHILALDLSTEQVASKATLPLFKKGENVLKKSHISR